MSMARCEVCPKSTRDLITSHTTFLRVDLYLIRPRSGSEKSLAGFLPPTPLIYSSHRSKRLLGLGIRVGGFIIARAGASFVAAPAAVVAVVVVATPHQTGYIATLLTFPFTVAKPLSIN
jgi:hypothetical protein